jgi:hypothetical protein
MWASGYNGDIRRAPHGYEPTREATMAAFANRLAAGLTTALAAALLPNRRAKSCNAAK